MTTKKKLQNKEILLTRSILLHWIFFSSATSEDGKDWPMISSSDVVYSKNHQNFNMDSFYCPQTMIFPSWFVSCCWFWNTWQSAFQIKCLGDAGFS